MNREERRNLWRKRTHFLVRGIATVMLALMMLVASRHPLNGLEARAAQKAATQAGHKVDSCGAYELERFGCAIGCRDCCYRAYFDAFACFIGW